MPGWVRNSTSAELVTFECLKKYPYTYNRSNVVGTLVLSFLVGSSSFLQVSRTTIKDLMSLIFEHTRVSCP